MHSYAYTCLPGIEKEPSINMDKAVGQAAEQYHRPNIEFNMLHERFSLLSSQQYTAIK